MELEIGDRITQAVEPFSIQVLGGTFTVAHLVLEPGTTVSGATQKLRAVPAEQWFVMVSDDEHTQPDSLAVIDDSLEFQVFALGRFRKGA